MANISDTAGIFVGGVLEAFNQMEFVIGRDGDVAYAQEEMLRAMQRVNAVTQVSTAGTVGKTFKKR